MSVTESQMVRGSSFRITTSHSVSYFYWHFLSTLFLALFFLPRKKSCHNLPRSSLISGQLLEWFNMIPRTRTYLRLIKQNASLRSHNLVRSRELVGVGHHFRKVRVLAIIPSQIYPEKLEWTPNADHLKFNGWLAQIHFNLIGQDIIAFLRRKLDNFRETRKFQPVQTHKIQFNLAVGIWITTHPFQRADPCTRPIIGTFPRKVPKCIGCINHRVVASYLVILLFI